MYIDKPDTPAQSQNSIITMKEKTSHEKLVTTAGGFTEPAVSEAVTTQQISVDTEAEVTESHQRSVGKDTSNTDKTNLETVRNDSKTLDTKSQGANTVGPSANPAHWTFGWGAS